MTPKPILLQVKTYTFAPSNLSFWQSKVHVLPHSATSLAMPHAHTKQEKANNTMQNGINNIQQSVNNSVNALQQQMNQMQEALLQMNSWEYTFEQNNGRKPYEIEKDQWMQQKYPGLYNLYIQSKYYYNSGTQVNEERGEDTYSQSYIIIKRLRLL